MTPAPHDKILLVEGRDDREVVFQFCNHHGIDNPGPARPRLGIWMMPDNRVEGMLEDFLLRLVHEHDPLVGRARDAVTGIPEAQRRFAPTYGSKAVAHTWLAWQQEPGTALGQAITKRYLDPARAPAPAFRRWLLELFQAQAPGV